MNKRKPKRSAEDIADVKRKKPKHKEAESTERAGSSSSDEAEYERAPRPSIGEPKGDNEKRVHYLLPLKAAHGKLILQEPAQLECKGQYNVHASSNSSSWRA